MFFLAGIFSALMLSGLVVMIDSDEDGRFEDKEGLEDNGIDARETQADRFVTGSDGAGSIQSGNATDDHLTGTVGPDQINGYAGHDRLSGGAGVDILMGGAGNDHLWGGDHNDQLRGDAEDDILNGDAGADRLFGGLGDDQLFGAAGQDTLSGGEGDDNLQGDAGNDALLGGYGNDRLEGGAGSDSLFGGPGDDVLIGQETQATADFLNGGAGNDILQSGGADSLHGGSGQDLFQIITAASAPEELTEISDFNPSHDHIEIWINDQQQTDPILEISQNNAGHSLVWFNQNPILSVLSEEKLTAAHIILHHGPANA
jgi:Ca2+-binding RTX toxin-like protein